MTAPPCHPWQLDTEEVARALGTDLARGLTQAEAGRRLEASGRNELVEPSRRSRRQLFAHQLANPMTMVLIGAGVVTLAIGDWTGTLVIAVIVVLNAVIGYLQEHRAELATAALARISTDTSRTLRDGALRDQATTELVPGDVVELITGDVIPADVRLADVRGLQVNEAAMTGESEPVAKLAASLPHVSPGALAAQHNMGYRKSSADVGCREPVGSHRTTLPALTRAISHHASGSCDRVRVKAYWSGQRWSSLDRSTLPVCGGQLRCQSVASAIGAHSTACAPHRDRRPSERRAPGALVDRNHEAGGGGEREDP
ncbi:MAG: cation-transporting P-type ATPase [Acidimicrobiia bacterium]